MTVNQIWETKIKIRAFDVDSSNRLKVSTILDYFQDAASNHAEKMKFGYADFVPLGLFWVLSWAKFEFTSFPKFMDEIKIQTWGKKQYKLYSVRDYLMFNSDDSIICKGTSAWLLLDSKSLRPKVLTQLFPDFKMLESKDALPDLPEKIISSTKNQPVYSTRIRYSDIDLNHHANNSKYIELMLDCYDEDFHKHHKIKSLTISFNSESKYGDEIEFFKGFETHEPLKHFLEGKNLNTGKSVFSSIIEWEKL